MMALQMCNPNTGGWEYMLEFEFIKAFSCTYANSIGFLVFGLMVVGAIGTSIYIRTGSVAIPAMLVLLTGGASLSVAASPLVAMASIVVIGLGAGALTLAWYNYSR